MVTAIEEIKVEYRFAGGGVVGFAECQSGYRGLVFMECPTGLHIICYSFITGDLKPIARFKLKSWKK